MATNTGPGGATQATSPTTGGTPSGGTPAGTDPAPTAPPPAPVTDTTTTATQEQLSANALVVQYLARFGLGALGTWAWQKILNGESFDQITLEIPDTETFKNVYPAYAEMVAKGIGFSVQDYVDYKRHVWTESARYGIPAEMYGTPERIADMLRKGVDQAEVTERFQIASAASMSAPKEVKDAVTALYGVDQGGFVAYYLDPELAMPILERQWAAAQIAGAASQQQMTSNRAEAERLAATGVTYDEARKGFGQAAGQAGLGAAGITREDRVAAAFGDTAAMLRIQRAQQTRTADFAGGGGAAETQQGVGGLLGAGTA